MDLSPSSRLFLAHYISLQQFKPLSRRAANDIPALIVNMQACGKHFRAHIFDTVYNTQISHTHPS
jgi:hypothetical protein